MADAPKSKGTVLGGSKTVITPEGKVEFGGFIADPPNSTNNTLSEIGISKHRAHSLRQLAKVDDGKCKDDPVAMDMLDRAVQRKPGGDISIRVNHPNDGKQDRSTKNLRRLRKDRPDLHQKVLDKEMTPHNSTFYSTFCLNAKINLK